ncbi:hypothetical protein [uncultured Tateyamaria sp.]|uniref:hypothetical protein n=1 Tax=Tateyamaria sp. 1078 TaxID=3417464 RepID=UPI00262E6027|nr:hypothetical protein [uncultured Tateyamaria sp.]
MTAILDDIRRLDAAHARGEMSTVELAAAKAKLMDSIPDITPDTTEPAPPPTQATEPRGTLGPMLMFCTIILIVCAGVALLLTGDLLLSATLAITVLAAFTVMLFRQLDG